ncbi:MAG TPA: hypothetical protein VFF94_05305 [Novosphingobium sp.]|nr:hypothetical protein [Novosphingobium sp.]
MTWLLLGSGFAIGVVFAIIGISVILALALNERDEMVLAVPMSPQASPREPSATAFPRPLSLLHASAYSKAHWSGCSKASRGFPSIPIGGEADWPNGRSRFPGDYDPLG